MNGHSPLCLMSCFWLPLMPCILNSTPQIFAYIWLAVRSPVWTLMYRFTFWTESEMINHTPCTYMIIYQCEHECICAIIGYYMFQMQDHALHLNGCSSVWAHMCYFRFTPVLNSISHPTLVNNHSPVCATVHCLWSPHVMNMLYHTPYIWPVTQQSELVTYPLLHHTLYTLVCTCQCVHTYVCFRTACKKY